jgi:hypothetical protein
VQVFLVGVSKEKNTAVLARQMTAERANDSPLSSSFNIGGEG